jgi:hypothetical protein
MIRNLLMTSGLTCHGRFRTFGVRRSTFNVWREEGEMILFGVLRGWLSEGYMFGEF